MAEPQFSVSSLRVFADLLGQLSIPASHPQLAQVAEHVERAREELQAALTAVEEADG